MKATAKKDLECVQDVQRAGTLLHPMRLSILEQAREPVSASTIADRLGLPRQKVNYHVRELAKARFLRHTGSRRKRNMLEQLYTATAQAYVLSPQLLGPVEADTGPLGDTMSAAYLLALGSRLQSEMTQVLTGANRQGKRVSTLSIQTELRFESATQRAQFTQALRDTLIDVVGRFSSPIRSTSGRAVKGRAYRLIVGCYPIPAPSPTENPEER